MRLAKLPPIHDQVEMPARVSAEDAVREQARVFPRGGHSTAHRRSKQAKFVPYEPYKGAVASMESKQSRKRPDLRAQKSNKSFECEVFDEGDKKYVTDGADRNKEESDDQNEEPRKEEISPELETNYRVMLDIKEKEIARLKERLDNSEKQLKIQTKVNGEVKRLLVASVGEDIEARVEFLSQDKARLAEDVLEYNVRWEISISSQKLSFKEESSIY